MTGQEVFEFYLILCKKHNDVSPAYCWDELRTSSRKVWKDMAELLAPEMSDEAKELLDGE